ncbi:DNA circularization protein [Rhodopila sp.]|uniref:DNA circularization protein n=1 Tax=Rhodopila sp. TaxID=2480087 RepID=UPI003D0BCCD1
MSGFLGGDVGSLLNFASNLKLGPWAYGLQPASWRGLSFAVRSSSIRRGRRIAVHEYPYSDTVWVEDLGRGTRSISFSGFLIGDDVYAQRDAMLAAMEKPGPGALVHPSLGSVMASLVGFSEAEQAEQGRTVEIELSFIESQSSPAFPTSAIATALQAITSAVQTAEATAQDFIGAVTTAIGGINAGLSFASNVFDTVKGIITSFSSLAISTAADSGATLGAVLGLPGNNGRYAYGAIPQPATATVATVIAGLTISRAAVAVAGGATTAIVDPTLLPAAVQALTEAVRAVAQAPADQIRLMANLAAFNPAITSSSAPVGAAIMAIQDATVHLFRAAALVSTANATSIYQPTSYDDALVVLQTVTDLLDQEAVAAADAGNTASYLALEALSAAIADDLLTRAANLPRLKVVTTKTPTPSLALAYALYADATRSDELIARGNPISPLFMPLSFQALSS